MKSNPKKNPNSKTDLTHKDSKEKTVSANHMVELTVTNNLGEDLIPKQDYNWFDSGGMKTTQSSIINGYASTVLFQETDYLKGCSGYIVYAGIQSGILLFIAFSNPYVGKNKLGVNDLYSTDRNEISANGQALWEKMSDHDYKPFQVFLAFYKSTIANCQCSGGKTNVAKVNLVHG